MTSMSGSKRRSAHAMRTILKASIVAVTLIASRADARTWRIHPDGSGDAPTIQAGIDSATTGDSLVMAPGLYVESYLLMTGKNLVLRGEAGAAATVVDAEQISPVLAMNEGTVEGLTLRGGLSPTGGGIIIDVSSNTTVQRCIIEDNRAGLTPDSGDGGGIYIGGATTGVRIQDNIIRANIAGGVGGGIKDEGFNNIISRNTIVGNQAVIQGGGVVTASASVENNLIARNHGGYHGGGIVASFGAAHVVGNTVIGNLTSNSLQNAAGIDADGAVAVFNNIIALNRSTSGGSAGVGLVADDAAVRCNDIWGNGVDGIVGGAVGERNFAQDPEFCGVDATESLNVFLQDDSPCAPGLDPNGGQCGLIGSAPVGCGSVKLQDTTWGNVKNLYR